MRRTLIGIVGCVALLPVGLVAVQSATAPATTTATFVRGGSVDRDRADAEMRTIAISHTVASQRETLPTRSRSRTIVLLSQLDQLDKKDAQSLEEAKGANVVFRRVLLHENGREIAELDLVTISSITIADGVHTVTLQYGTIQWK